MIWYRYWLELRLRLLALAVVAIWMGISASYGTNSGGFAQAPMLKTPLAQSIGPENIFIWIKFSSVISFIAWVAGVGLMGNGIFTAWQRPHASVNYTLTLPVSRQRLICIYQFGNCAAALVATFLAMVSCCAALLLQGHEFPLVPLAVSLAFGSLFVIAWMTILGGLTMVMHEIWAMLAGIPLFLVSIPWVRSTVTSFPAYGEFPWVSVAALLMMTVLALAFSLLQSRQREFA